MGHGNNVRGGPLLIVREGGGMETMLGWTFISWEGRRRHGNNVRVDLY